MTDQRQAGKRRWRATVAALAIGVTGFLVGVGYGCGSVTDDRDAAINSATTAACNRYQACNAIGPSGSYATISDCQTDWKAKFTNQWTQADCEGRIDQTMLNVCRDAINGTSCTSVLDILNTFLVKCSAAAVCDLPADAGRG
jgi:hypothetical protein